MSNKRKTASSINAQFEEFCQHTELLHPAVHVIVFLFRELSKTHQCVVVKDVAHKFLPHAQSMEL